MNAALELGVFAGVIVLGQFSPGPDMILLTRTALHRGAGDGVRMAAGIACGLMIHSTIAVAGMATAFERLPMLRRALQWIAAVYLAWIGFNLLRDRFATRHAAGAPSERADAPRHPPFIRGLLCNLLNPKVALFLAAVCAPFLAGNHPPWWPVAIWGVIVGLGFGLWSLWVILLQWPPLRRTYERCAPGIDAVFAILLLGLAIRLAAQ